MSVNTPKSQWRLTTPGGIPVKVVERSGSFEGESASAREVYIMKASDLLDFVTESFPLPFALGGSIFYPRRRDLPGLGSLVTNRVSYEALVGGRPIDPFSTDTSAPDGTYEENIRVTIEYATRPENDQEADPNDPKTFLQISSRSSGEFLTQPVRGTAKWGSATGDDVTDIDVPKTVIETSTEWNLTWPQIPQEIWEDSIQPRLRTRMGKVNDSSMSIIDGAPAETVLLVGYSRNQQFSWRTGFSGKPFVSVDVVFIEKNFIGPNGTQVTHNHFFRPETGNYERLFIDGTNETFKTADMDGLFLP